MEAPESRYKLSPTAHLRLADHDLHNGRGRTKHSQLPRPDYHADKQGILPSIIPKANSLRKISTILLPL